MSDNYQYKMTKNDECYTPEYAIEPLKEFIKPFVGKICWCPFDKENSNFVKLLSQWGLKVLYGHIDYGHDYYKYEPQKWDVMISNPPFTGKREIFERALSFNKPFALLMTLTWLNDSAPKKLFYEKDLQLLMFDKRIKYINCGNQPNFSSAYYCWNFLPKQIIMRNL